MFLRRLIMPAGLPSNLWLAAVFSRLLGEVASQSFHQQFEESHSVELPGSALVLVQTFQRSWHRMVPEGQQVHEESIRSKTIEVIGETAGNTSYAKAAESRYDDDAPFLQMPQQIWKFFHSSEQGKQKVLAFTTGAEVIHSSQTLWIGIFFSTLALVPCLTYAHSRRMRHEMKEMSEEDGDMYLAAVRGRPCWNMCCLMIYIVSSTFIFWVAYIMAGAANKAIEKDPYIDGKAESDFGSGHVAAIKLRVQMLNPALCAYLSSLGLMFSLFIAGMIITNWRSSGSRPAISTSLLVQFMLRGASLSIVVAIALEYSGQRFIRRVTMAQPRDTFWHGDKIVKALLMVVVGFSEEFAKLIAATCGTCLSKETLEETSGGCWCCNRICCRVLLESPKALALAGLAAGFGFMAVENVEYVMVSALKPVATPVGTTTEQILSEQDSKSGVAVITILVRVFFNIHPWLTGLSTVRLGQVAFDGEPTTACLGPFTLLWAVFPSALIHAVYDYLIVAIPIIGGLAVPFIWYCCRYLFMRQWPEDPED